MATKVTGTQILIGFVVVAGAYRLIKTREKNRRLEAAKNPTALKAAANQNFVDWRTAGTPDGIQSAIETTIGIDGAKINSSNELAYAVGARIWPGASIHPSGLDAVQSAVRSQVVWDGVPNTDAWHEACVRMRCRGTKALFELSSHNLDRDELAEALASSVFPEINWPSSEEHPDWAQHVWAKCQGMASAVRSAQEEDADDADPTSDEDTSEQS